MYAFFISILPKHDQFLTGQFLSDLCLNFQAGCPAFQHVNIGAGRKQLKKDSATTCNEQKPY
jgi:hypothetical protein